MSLIVEFGLRKTKLSFRKLITTIIRNIKEDILSPLLFVKEILNTILTLLSKVFRLKKPFVWYNNTIIVLVSLFYILIYLNTSYLDSKLQLVENMRLILSEAV